MVGSYVFVKARLLLLLMSSHPHFYSLEKKANCLLAGSCMSGKSISSMILLRLYLEGLFNKSPKQTVGIL